MKPDRRSQERDGVDRRYSARWETDELLHWRVWKGRRRRESRVIAQSLNGLVLQVEPRDYPRAESRVLVDDPAEIEKFGFRSAVVTRSEALDDGGGRLVFAEIEA
ncbi:MAG: hypothetical protein KKB50_20865 [Planctomycetes bacterium]|nr:hypothetical protein [Planctomycetota bacterium]